MLLENESIHMTDFSFLKFCMSHFNINRGMYNTIDSWFYERGETDILQRRKRILSFLQYVNANNLNQSKFGKGGLSDNLREFSYYFIKN